MTDIEETDKEMQVKIETQYNAVRTDFGVIDRSGMGKLAISGADRFTWLQGMVSNDIRLLEKGATNRLQACMLDATGHVISTMALINVNLHSNSDLHAHVPDKAPFVLMELPPANVAKIAALLDRYIIMEDVEIEDVSCQWGCLSIQGLRAVPQTGDDSKANWSAAFKADVVDLSDLNLDKTFSFRAEADYTGNGGWDLFLSRAEYLLLKERWHQQGYQFIGHEAQEVLRIEAGIPKYGMDIDETTLAPEAGLMTTHVSLTKGCYVGQEIVARIDSRGHTNRALTGLVFAEGDVPAFGDKIFASEAEAVSSTADKNQRETGRVTSVVTASPALNGSPIALGYVRHEHREPGRRLQVQGGTRMLEAEVFALPFYIKPVYSLSGPDASALLQATLVLE